MSGFVATSGKYEVFAPGDDTQVLFNDSNDVNAVSSLTFTKGTATLQSTIFKSAKLMHDTGDLTIQTDGGSAGGIILDAEDDTVEIQYSGATGATFGLSGLNIVAGDTYSIDGTAVLSATGATLVQSTAVTSLSALGDGAAHVTNDYLLIYDADASALKKISPDYLGVGSGSGGGAGTDVLQRALRNLDLVEVDAS